MTTTLLLDNVTKWWHHVYKMLPFGGKQKRRLFNVKKTKEMKNWRTTFNGITSVSAAMGEIENAQKEDYFDELKAKATCYRKSSSFSGIISYIFTIVFGIIAFVQIVCGVGYPFALGIAIFLATAAPVLALCDYFYDKKVIEGANFVLRVLDYMEMEKLKKGA